MNKGIFWCYVTVFDDDMFSHTINPVMVRCDRDGKALEEVEYSSKSGENFNHKIEWEKKTASVRKSQRKPFDYYPRGRVEVTPGSVKVFANPVIIADEDAKKAIVQCFELEEVKDDIKWIADNSKHYRYCRDAMGDAAWLDDDEEE
jgi:hypothetical protein